MCIEAEAKGVQLFAHGNDNKRDRVDLMAAEPYNIHLSWARGGEVDGYHCGFPCTSFSRLRLRPAPGLPGLVRDRDHLYGLPDNSPAQQLEAAKGTQMAVRSITIIKAMEHSESQRWSLTVASLEIQRSNHTPRLGC